MKAKVLIFLSFLCSSLVCLQGEETSVEMEMPLTELEAIDQLIEVSRENLKNQELLKELLIEYKKAQEVYFKNPEDRKAASKMVVLAKKVLSQIEENHLKHLFKERFISELTMLSQMANKKQAGRS